MNLNFSADKYYIRRFLRARQHDIPKAKQFYSEHLKWRRENAVDTIMTSFDFHERDVFLTLYPQGYHKTDKEVLQSFSSATLCRKSPFGFDF